MINQYDFRQTIVGLVCMLSIMLISCFVIEIYDNCKEADNQLYCGFALSLRELHVLYQSK